jgi:polysaccharide export outer membrane protein
MFKQSSIHTTMTTVHTLHHRNTKPLTPPFTLKRGISVLLSVSLVVSSSLPFTAAYAQAIEVSTSAAGVSGGGAGGGFNTATTTNAANTTNVTLPAGFNPSLFNNGLADATKDAGKDASKTTASAGAQAGQSNSFQLFLQSSLGKALPLFGQQLFDGHSDTFAASTDTPVPATYTLGVGDELLIRTWGGFDMDYRATIDRAGNLSIPKIGTFTLSGVRFGDVEQIIGQQIGRYYRNFNLSVTMGRARSMRVFVVGYVNKPGAYTLPSVSTALNALMQAGGPSGAGSLRRIEIKRQGQSIGEIDLYDFLLRGDKSKDLKLHADDTLYVHPVGNLVAVHGQVNLPAIYEYKTGETFKDLLGWSGGTTVIANTQRVMLDRQTPQKNRTTEHSDLSASLLAKPLQNGDVLELFAMSRQFERTVTLRGNVASPIRFPWREGLRITDLLPTKNALITADYFAQRETAQFTKTTSTTGLRNDVKQVLKEPNWDYAVVERISPARLEPELLPFNLGQALDDPLSVHNLALQSGDVITIFNKDDIQVPMAKQTRFVRLEGEFASSGVYKAQPNETLRQLITRIGGVTPDAFLYGLEFNRESTRKQQEVRYQEALDRMELDLIRSATSNSATSVEDAVARKAQQESQAKLISRMRTIRPNGRISFGFQSPQVSLRDLPDVTLEDGDTIILPAKSATIAVFGSVMKEGAFLHQSNKTIGDYIALAGGASRDADRSYVFVIRADGSVVSQQSKGMLSGLASEPALPGDTIYMPEQQDKNSFIRKLKDWTSILSQFGLGAAAIKVLK